MLDLSELSQENLEKIQKVLKIILDYTVFAQVSLSGGSGGYTKRESGLPGTPTSTLAPMSPTTESRLANQPAFLFSH